MLEHSPPNTEEVSPANGDANDAPWLRRFRVRVPTVLRLICFPSAGAGASLCSAWAGGLPAGVEVCAVQMPGREDRRREPLLTRLPDAVREICSNLQVFRDKPFVLFGHSVGALIAFETARTLRTSAISPLHFFCSALRAPEQVASRERLHLAGDREFLDRVRRFGGIPEAILNEPELMRMFTPILRADFEIQQTYQYHPAPPFQFPITAFAGSHDPEVAPDAMDQWRGHTAGGFTRHIFPGGHFFLQSHRAVFLKTLSAALERIMFERTL